jgi:hypothetical protein
MTAGGFWAIVPDMPRLWRVDFPSLPFAGTLGDIHLERWLHRWGDIFFFHHQLDAQPKEFALHGLIGMIFLYNLALALLLWLEHRQRNSIGNRAWRGHANAPRPSLRLTERSEDNSRSMAHPRSSHLSRAAYGEGLIEGLGRGKTA